MEILRFSLQATIFIFKTFNKKNLTYSVRCVLDLFFPKGYDNLEGLAFVGLAFVRLYVTKKKKKKK